MHPPTFLSLGTGFAGTELRGVGEKQEKDMEHVHKFWIVLGEGQFSAHTVIACLYYSLFS